MNIWPWSVITRLRTANETLHGLSERYENDLRARQNQIEFLIRTLRGIDEQIFKISQLTGWDQMKPHFSYLNEGMLVRKRVESDRINDLMLGELNKTYDGPMMLGDR